MVELIDMDTKLHARFNTVLVVYFIIFIATAIHPIATMPLFALLDRVIFRD